MHTIWDAGAILHATVCLFYSSFFLNNPLLSLINISLKSIQYRSHTKRMMFEILISGRGQSGIGGVERIKDPYLSSHIHWDLQRHFVFDG